MAKVLISLPDELLERLDGEAERRAETRSGFIREAVSRELGWPDERTIEAALERGRGALATLSLDSAAAIRTTRDELDERDRRR
ncbi:MAG: ribbon-helix-helix protein, CopG family [Solirubrobacterales bacterium]|nr:ribbon-helix-helix protein, CopG family [Solirubrobacterales bacterium]MCB8969181.1 ribbon-helix-helix protein, CopG family [Thermoleophilales bacterium]MCO5328008.1 type II toxin-antitoxin system HicB family antitoxin [Solirubrobacterales bacterium]